MLTVGSLFAGIGGFDLGLERAGMRTVWQVEQDEFCRRVLARHFPDAERFVDVRDVRGCDVERVDVLCGGFPCQPVSRGAGDQRLGRDDERWMWPEYARLVREVRPRYVIVENTPGLLDSGWLGDVLGDLASLGYDAEWECVSAAAAGAVHVRERLWLVAYPTGAGRGPARPVFPRGAEGWRSLRFAGRSARWEAEPAVGRVANGFPRGLAQRQRLKALGNALVPQIAEWIGRRIIEWEAACPQ